MKKDRHTERQAYTETVHTKRQSYKRTGIVSNKLLDMWSKGPHERKTHRDSDTHIMSDTYIRH